MAVVGLEVGLAALAYVASELRFCPTIPGPFSCVALVRPRLATLGPFSVAQLALIGSVITLALALWLRRRQALTNIESLVIAGVPAAGAGFALGIQLLPIQVAQAICPLCLVLAISALLSAAVLTRASRTERLAIVGGVFVVALVGTGLMASLRASSIETEDAVRRDQLSEVGGERGPQLYLVSKPDCPYCEAMVLDVLLEPEVQELLEKTRGFKTISEDDPLAQAHAGGRGAPVLFAISDKGEPLGRLRGFRDEEHVKTWLRSKVLADQ